MTTEKSYFKTIQKFKAEYATAEFTQYVSERTGMRVMVVNQKGPRIYGYFALATEIHDDSGAPHTLEHLCFMGSKSYKYKGVLDQLATRAYSFTNAWTSTDHTAYTLHTAGWAGFAQILPVYLEHVLFPTLTDAGCYTEVHHIDGEGKDAGVVYSEMQAVQNTQQELMELRARRLIYPEGNGFRYETGGMMEALRVLTAERIREFHGAMYQPKNLCLVLIGEVDEENMVEVLDKFEDGIIDDVPPLDAPFTRPWVDSEPTPPLTGSTIDTVEFPEEDETMGEVLIGFLGPKSDDLLNRTAMDVLLKYLTESTVSLLHNTLVEKEQLASGIPNYIDTRPNSVIWITLASVATKKLAYVEARFFEILRDATSKPLDMDYMEDCIHRWRRQIMYMTESSPTVFADQIIENHLFGRRDGKDLREQLATLDVFDEVAKWDDAQWREFLSKWLAHAHHVSILGMPSAKLSKKLKEEEKERVKAQQERLGPDGLKELAKKLEEAKAENDKPIPNSIIEQFEIPGTDTIHFFPTTTARSGLAKQLSKKLESHDIQKIVDKDGADESPLFIHFEHIPTNFVHYSLIITPGEDLPRELKPLLSVYLENFFSTPIMRNGKKVDFEQVVTELERETVTFRIGVGHGLGNSEVLRVRMVVERDKYEPTIGRLKEMLFCSVWDEERINATLTRLLAEIPDEKRSGNSMLQSVDTMMHYGPTSSLRAQDTLVRALYLKRLKALLAKNPSEVFSKLTELKSHLLRFDHFRATVFADMTRLTHPVSAWKALTDSMQMPASPSLTPLPARRAMLSDAGRRPGGRAFVVPMAPIDSSYATLVAAGPTSYDDASLPALMVALAYLDAVEGPMWVGVRGTGLAYGTYFTRSVDVGLLAFRIYRSPDAFKAYRVARDVVEGYIDGTRELEKHALEGAVSSIVTAFAGEQDNMIGAATVAFVDEVVKGVGKGWNDEMLKKVRQVKMEEIRTVLKELVLPVFEPSSANLIVTCAEIMKEGLKKNFEEAGFKPDIQPLTYFQDDYGLEPVEGEDEYDPDVDEDEDSASGSEDDDSDA
ncbi:metallopeptidase [Lineolata rhizophorae]|uniref:Metallopeptidase n=1 Tax=Lineolata rhizophorae TaxID=578093 RepID=A0A6A6NTL6_9PEZI|nr:metallopeptidase [Lineolata rhizophorae]